MIIVIQRHYLAICQGITGMDGSITEQVLVEVSLIKIAGHGTAVTMDGQPAIIPMLSGMGVGVFSMDHWKGKDMVSRLDFWMRQQMAH